jgi:negative regulator of sigma E activity
MLNRITLVGLAIAAAVALLVIVLVSPTIGPQASRAEFGTPSLSIEGLHRQVDHRKLPVQAIPEP